MWDIRLSKSEWSTANVVGKARMDNVVQHDRKGNPYQERHYNRDDYTLGLRRHVNGAACEMAVAKRLNMFWPATIGIDPNSFDVGDCMEVRGTDLSYGNLLLYPKDRNKDYAAFVFVIKDGVRFSLKGWMRGMDGMTDRFYDPG